MEQVMQAAPDVGATTPDMSVAPADTGQPAQQTGVAPEGIAPEGQQPELTPQEEYFLQAGTGTVYKTKEAAIAGIEEKDRLIKQFFEQRTQQPPPQPQPAADPQAEVIQAISQLQSEIEADYRSDPKYAGYSPEAISEQAYIDAKNAYRLEQRISQQYEQRQRQTEMKQFFDNTPELHTDVAHEVWNKFQQMGFKMPSPQVHLELVRAEMIKRGMPPMQGQPQTGNMGVQGALQNQQRPLFSQPGGTGVAPQATGPMSDVARRQIEFAQSRGITGERLEAIKQRALQNEAGFKR